MKSLMKKMAIIRATIGKMEKGRENPFYKSKYFDINDLLEQLDPLIEDLNLVLMQPVDCDSNGSYLKTVLYDLESSDEYETCIRLPELSDPQKIGSCLTYYRRYSLQSLFCLRVGDGEDDDANLASGKTTPKRQQKPIHTWLTEQQFQTTLDCTNYDQVFAVLKSFNGENGRGMKKEYRAKLENHLNGIVMSDGADINTI